MGASHLDAAAILLAAAVAQATIAGTVRDERTAAPLPGAAVVLPDLDLGTTTDAEGRYALRGIPSGPQHVRVQRIGYASRTLHALVPDEGALTIDVHLRPEPLRMSRLEVLAPVPVRGLDSMGTRPFPDRETSMAAVRNHPILAEPDPFQALGGGEAALRLESPGGIHLRGGATDQTAYLLDGVPVFNPYHAAGVSSAWNPDALSRLHLTASQPSLDHPHVLSGTVEAVTRPPATQSHGYGTLTTTQARLTLSGPLGRQGAGYVASARLGLPDWFVPEDEASYIRGETGDAMGKFEAPVLGGHIRALGFGNRNRLDAAEAIDEDQDPGDRRNVFEWRGHSLGLDWRKDAPTAVRVLGFGAVTSANSRWAAEPSRLEMTSSRRDYGLLAVVERTSERGTTGLGVRLERIETSYGVRSDSVGLAPYRIEPAAGIATLLARHARPLGRAVHLDVQIAGAWNGELHAAPRAQVRWSPWGKLELTGSLSRTHQFAQSLRNPESVLGNIFPVELFVAAGDSEAPVGRSDQAMIAADFRPAAGARLGVQAYWRESEGLILVAPRTGEPFAVGTPATGAGSSRGVSAEVAISGTRYGFLASYGLQDVQVEVAGSRYTPEYGTTHRLEGGVTFHPMATASIRFGAVAELGRRTTPAAVPFEWEACNLLDQGCEFMGSPHHRGESLGGTDLPGYYRLDVGVRKHWHVGVAGRDVTLALFGSGTNLLGRKNVMTYARDPSSGGLLPIEMRPRAPLVVGVDWSF